jgi:ribosome-associated toxin RatA of RatAB toxin-antitoxin module
MPVKEVSRQAIVGCPAALLYTLVNRIENYPKWFAWCTAAKVIEQDPSRMLATLSVKLAGIDLSFTTENKLVPEREIHLALRDGPFKQLGGVWRFEPLGQIGCKVQLRLQFDLGSGMLASALSPAISAWADKMVDDFVLVAKKTMQDAAYAA